MRLRIMLALLVAVLALVVVPIAASFGGPDPNSTAMATCSNNIDKQSANGVFAGGGPKAGIPAPTSRDRFFSS